METVEYFDCIIADFLSWNYNNGDSSREKASTSEFSGETWISIIRLQATGTINLGLTGYFVNAFVAFWWKITWITAKKVKDGHFHKVKLIIFGVIFQLTIDKLQRKQVFWVYLNCLDIFFIWLAFVFWSYVSHASHFPSTKFVLLIQKIRKAIIHSAHWKKCIWSGR